MLERPDFDRKAVMALEGQDARHLAAPRERRVEQLVVGQHAVHEPELVRLLGADRVPRQDGWCPARSATSWDRLAR